MDPSAPDSSSISLDLIRKSAISRRGGVRVRGGRLPPIRIKDIVPITSSKKIIAPKIPQRRIAIKKEVSDFSDRAPTHYRDDRKDIRKLSTRGRGQKVYIQTEGSFLGQGPAHRLKKETVTPHYGRTSRSSSRMKPGMDNKINMGQIHLLLEEYDDQDEYLDYENDIYPVRFPYIKKETKPKIKEENSDNKDVKSFIKKEILDDDFKTKIKEEILDDEDVRPRIKEEILDHDFKTKIKEEILDTEAVKLKIKKEPEDETDKIKENWILPDVKTTKGDTSEPQICSLLEVMKLSEEDVFLLFQLPSSLPFKAFDDNSDKPSKKDRNPTGEGEKVENPQDEMKGMSFKDIPEGYVGKLQVMKSGRMRLALESVDLAIEGGVNEGSMAEVVSISLANKDEGDFIVLGKIYQKMIMCPILNDFEEKIKHEEAYE